MLFPLLAVLFLQILLVCTEMFPERIESPANTCTSEDNLLGIVAGIAPSVQNKCLPQRSLWLAGSHRAGSHSCSVGRSVEGQQCSTAQKHRYTDIFGGGQLLPNRLLCFCGSCKGHGRGFLGYSQSRDNKKHIAAVVFNEICRPFVSEQHAKTLCSRTSDWDFWRSPSPEHHIRECRNLPCRC